MTDEELIARLRQDDTDFWHFEAAEENVGILTARVESLLSENAALRRELAKGGADPAALSPDVQALLADLARGPMRGELMAPWIRRMMDRARRTYDAQGS